MKVTQLTCLLLTVLFALVASKKTVVKKAGDCSGKSVSKIKLAPQNGKLEIEFEVEHKAGEIWAVVITRRGSTILSKSYTMGATTQSFDARVVNGPGTGGNVVATATSQSSGEVCSVSTSYP